MKLWAILAAFLAIPIAAYAQPTHGPNLPPAAIAIGGAPLAPPKVLFDRDKANLTPRVVQMIAEAASLKKVNCFIKVDVSGYHDSPTTADYKLNLAERRAKVVAAQLVADGIPAAEIKTQTYFKEPNFPGDAPSSVPEAKCGIIEIALY